MLPASNRGVGMNIGFPDVCLTPAVPAPVPIPYPNLAMNAMATPFVPTILLSMMPALNMGSIIPMTMGDNAGVAHPFFMQAGMYTMGNPKILLQGLPAINLTCPTSGNNMNNPVGAVLVPSVTNVFFTYAEATSDAAHMDATLARGGAMTTRLLPGSDAVGYLKLAVFARGVAGETYGAAFELAKRGARSLLIDLRDNPGGEMDAFIELAGDFLEEGALVTTMVDGDGDRVDYRAPGGTRHALPVVLLVNRRTASAAELFAGALQAHGRAVVVGERTFGKGTGLRLVAGELVSCARYVLPSGAEVHDAGITPELAMSDLEMDNLVAGAER